jgi:conjugal transfer ATP-binding protein TraC
VLAQMTQKVAKLLGESNAIGTDTASPTIQQMNAYLEKYPLASLLPYNAYDPDSGLFFNHKSTGFVIEASPLTGLNEETLSILSGLLADNLPAGVCLQFLLWASPKISGSLDAWSAHRSGRGEIYEQLAAERVKFLAQGAFQSLSQEDSYLIRDFQLIISVSMSHSGSEDNKAALISLRDNFLNTFRSIHLTAQAMPIERFMSLVSDLINPTLSTEAQVRQWDPYNSLSQQLVSAENHLLIDEDGLQFSHAMEARCFSVHDFPKAWAQWGMNELIGDLYRDALRLPCPFLIQFSVTVPERDKAEARAQFKRMRADQQGQSPLARFIPSLQRVSEDWSFTCQRLEEGDRLVEGFFQVILIAEKVKMNCSEMALKNLFHAKGWKFKKDKYLALQSWLACLPMIMGEGLQEDLKRFGRFRTLPSFTATNLLPLQGEWKGMSTPRLLLTGRRGQMLWWDNFDNVEGNYNVAVVGKSGSGKSVFMQELMTAILGSGGRVWVIDVGRSFAKTCAVLGGEFIEFTAQSNICINPFTFIRDFNDALSMLKPLVAMMAKPTSRITDHESAFLEQALKDAWEKHENAANVTAVADWLLKHGDPRAVDLGTSLFPYTAQGMYARFFEGCCTLDLTNSLLVLELEELKGKKDLQEVVLLVLMYQVTEAMYRGSRDQHLACIIDEAWDLLRGEQSGEFVETGCRRARKYEGAFITGTQSIHDYYKTPAAKAAFENSDWLCLLSQKPESIDELKERKRLSMDGHMERLLKSVKTVQGSYAEIMIYGPPGFAVARLILDPFSEIMYTSKGAEYAAVQQLQREGKTLIQAIQRVAEKTQMKGMRSSVNEN